MAFLSSNTRRYMRVIVCSCSIYVRRAIEVDVIGWEMPVNQHSFENRLVRLVHSSPRQKLRGQFRSPPVRELLLRHGFGDQLGHKTYYAMIKWCTYTDTCI